MLLKELDSLYTRQGLYKELEFYQCVTNVVAATTTLQIFSFGSFWSLLPKIIAIHLTLIRYLSFN